jgi:hypothetical protein
MKFYSIKQKKPIMVPESKVKYRTTKNGRKQATAVMKGEKLFKFVAK